MPKRLKVLYRDELDTISHRSEKIGPSVRRISEEDFQALYGNGIRALELQAKMRRTGKALIKDSE